jgi:acetyl-CoA carboxylase biotin carboxyl carrier protein
LAKQEVRSEIAGTVAQIAANVGAAVEKDQDIVVLEAMKMEIPVPTPASGTVLSIHVKEGATINEGDLIATIDTEA